MSLNFDNIVVDGNTLYESKIDLVTYAKAKNAAILSVPGLDGISGWLFDIPTGESVDLTAEITDHYIESGSFVSDHAVIKPIKITLTGFIGNLVFKVPQPGTAEYVAEQTQSKLSAVNSYLGDATPGAVQTAAGIAAQAGYVANQIKAIAKRATNVIDFFKGESQEPDPQTKAYHELKALWLSKQTVSVQTPWEFFGSMMIETISAKKDDASNGYTDFSITLKETRMIGIERTNFDAGAYKAAIDVQSASPVAKGPVQGERFESALHFAKRSVTGGN